MAKEPTAKEGALALRNWVRRNLENGSGVRLAAIVIHSLIVTGADTDWFNDPDKPNEPSRKIIGRNGDFGWQIVGFMDADGKPERPWELRCYGVLFAQAKDLCGGWAVGRYIQEGINLEAGF